VEKVFCNCEDWERGIASLEELALMAFFRGILYDGKIFKYCPWCGRRLDHYRGPVDHYRGPREGLDEFGHYCKLKKGGNNE